MEWNEKKQLLEDLFIHRRDVIAHHKGHWTPRGKSWINTTNGRRAVEEYKPYEPENGDSILYHHAVEGSERVGVYPHALDNTTKTITADFDSDDNKQTVAEMFSTCLSLKQVLCSNGVASYIERSHSGSGFHVWIFFEKPINCDLATKVMVEAFKQAGLLMAVGANGYDRLFPCVTKVGKSRSDKKPWVGNIIGLPLQAAAAAKGNCVFLDDSGEVIEDQWGFLSNIQKVSEQTALDFTQHTEHIQSHIPTVVSNGETIGWDYWKALAHVSGQLDRMKGCAAIQEHIVRPNNFDNRQWALGIIGNLAVFTANDDLEEDVINFAYEIEKNYTPSPGAADTTLQTLMARKDHLQNDEYPMSCKEMFGGSAAWICPKLETCRYNFISKYNAPPSFTIYSPDRPITVQERVELSQLEQLGLYEKFRKILPWGDKIPDYLIAQHLLGIRPIGVYTVNFKDDTVKSIFQAFENDEDAQKFISLLRTKKNIEFAVNKNNEVWMIGHEPRQRTQAVQLIRYLLNQLDLESELSLELNDLNMPTRYEVIAPYFGQLTEIQLLCEGRKENESK